MSRLSTDEVISTLQAELAAETKERIATQIALGEAREALDTIYQLATPYATSADEDLTASELRTEIRQTALPWATANRPSDLPGDRSNRPDLAHSVTVDGQTFLIQPAFGCVSWFSDDPKNLERSSGGLMSAELGDAITAGARRLTDYGWPDCPAVDVTAPESQLYLDEINTAFGTCMDLSDFAGR